MSYQVTVRIPDRPIENKDTVFTIKKKGARFGRLKVSKGAVVWLPGGKSKGFRLTWQQVARLAAKSGRPGHYPI